jgi:hypothetical protein
VHLFYDRSVKTATRHNQKHFVVRQPDVQGYGLIRSNSLARGGDTARQFKVLRQQILRT